jgi:hypothetical protein
MVMEGIKTRFRQLIENYEKLDIVKFPTNTYIDLNYNFSGKIRVQRNTVGGEYMGSRFGQDVEPVGYYCTQQENTFFNDNPDYEFKEVYINKPVVIRTCDETRVRWKHDLSKLFGGSIRKRLSNKLIKNGYDSIITADENGYSWEIVLLK